jgi:hypothetical protein
MRNPGSAIFLIDGGCCFQIGSAPSIYHSHTDHKNKVCSISNTPPIFWATFTRPTEITSQVASELPEIACNRSLSTDRNNCRREVTAGTGFSLLSKLFSSGIPQFVLVNVAITHRGKHNAFLITVSNRKHGRQQITYAGDTTS